MSSDKTENNNDIILKIENVNRIYKDGENETVALSNVNLEVHFHNRSFGMR